MHAARGNNKKHLRLLPIVANLTHFPQLQSSALHIIEHNNMQRAPKNTLPFTNEHIIEEDAPSQLIMPPPLGLTTIPKGIETYIPAQPVLAPLTQRLLPQLSPPTSIPPSNTPPLLQLLSIAPPLLQQPTSIAQQGHNQNFRSNSANS